jgi:high-affinity nickel-transport protein
VHGLAGSAAVALLVLTTIRQPFWAILYLLLFGIGTIAGMVLITTAMAIPFAYAGQRMSRTRRGLQIATGVVSLVFGAVLAYQIGYVDGLFSASVHWTPH